ncbi:glycerol-3-phosphate acyltransferase mino isoform X2 [Rhynchophorus ferrugineus]
MVTNISNKFSDLYNRYTPLKDDEQTEVLTTFSALKQLSNERKQKTNLNKIDNRGVRATQLFHIKETVPDLNVTLRLTFMAQSCQSCPVTNNRPLVKTVTEHLSLINILRYKPPHSGSGFLGRTFSHLHQVSQLKRYRYPQVSSFVLKDDRVIKAIEKTAIRQFQEMDTDNDDEVYMKILKATEKRAQKILFDMRSTLSDFLLRFTSWILYKLLPCFLGSVVVHPGQVEVLQEASKTNLPLIFLPLHRSHLDYILISFILLNNNIRSPLVAAGDNLRIPFFGSLLRGLGAFYIRRRLHPTMGPKDHVYKSILHTYMNLCLKAGHNIEFFLEGGRTRTGKPCMPKYGILSVIVDSFLDGTIEDALLVPVSVNYEKLVDGNFIKEQLGQPKKMETFGQTLKGIWNVLNSNYGMMRIDFNQPFSLKDIISSINSSPRSMPVSIQHRTLKSNPSTNSLYGTDVVSEDQKILVENISKHVIYDCSQATTVMSTNILAFLLLNKYRKGVNLQELAEALDELKRELLGSRRNIGFQGDSVDVINYAIDILGPGLVGREKQKSETVIKPVSILPNVIELSYYSNTVVAHFALDSVLAIAINVTEQYRNMLAHEDLINNASSLCDIFQYEFLFCKPCQVLEQVLISSLDNLVARKELFEAENDSELVMKSKRIASRFDDDDDDDANYRYFQKQYKMNVNQESVDTLTFLSNILKPLLETYSVTAFMLDKLVQTQLLENEFIDLILDEMKNQLFRGTIEYDESIAVDPIKNALKLFQKWGVVECHNEGKTRLYYLKESHDDTESVQEIYNRVNRFRLFNFK